MADVGMVIRIAASLAELKRNLAAGRDSVEVTTAGMKKLASSLDGSKLEQKAHNIAAAINEIGGITKLTDQEQARYNNTLQQYLEKADRMGKHVPPAIRDIATQTQAAADRIRAAEKNTTSWGNAWGLVQKFIPIATIGGAATALIGLASGAFKSAGQIVDLATKADLSTETIQRMQHVARKTNTELEVFTGNTFKLGVAVAEGTTKVRDAVRDLGLEYTTLRQMKPEEQFAVVMKALEGMTNEQERNRIGQALFGKQFSEMVIAIKEGYTEIASGAKVIADEHLKAMKRAAEDWDQWVADRVMSFKAFLGEIVSTSAKVRDGFKGFTPEQQQELALRMGQEGFDVTALIAQFEAVNKAKQASAQVTQTLIAFERDYVGELADAHDRLKNLTAADREQLDAALKVGAGLEDLKEKYQLTDEAIRLYQSTVRDATKAGNDATKAGNDLAEAWDRQIAQQNELVAGVIAYAEAVRTGLVKAHELARDSSKKLWDGELTRAKALNDSIASNFLAEVKARGDLVTVTQQTELQKLQVQVNTAKRRGASAREAFELERQLSRQQLDFTIANLEQQFRAVVAGLNLQTEGGRRAYEVLRSVHKQTVDNMVANWEDGIRQQVAALPSLRNSLTTVLAGIPQQLVNAFTGGGGLMGAIKAIGIQLAQAIAKPIFDGIVSAITKAMATKVATNIASNVASSAASKAIGSAAGGAAGTAAVTGGGIALSASTAAWTAGLSLAAIAVWKIWQHNKNLNKEVKEFNVEIEKQRAALLKTHGDFNMLERKAAAVGMNFAAEWGHQGKAGFAAFKKYIEDFEKKFESLKEDTSGTFDGLVESARNAGIVLPAHFRDAIQQMVDLGLLTKDALKQFDELAKPPNWSQMKAAAQELGLDFATLGKSFNGARVADEAELILSKFTLLKRGGVDVGDMLRQTSGRVSQLVRDAMATGTALPEQLREYVAELARTGQLFDDNRLKSNAWAKGLLENSRDIPAGLQDIIRKFMETGDMAMTADELMSQFGSNPAMAEIIRQMQAYDDSIGDSNGQLRDLSRLNWAEPMERSVNRLIDAFSKLIDKILGVGTAAGTITPPRLPDTGGPGGFFPERPGSSAFGGAVSSWLRGGTMAGTVTAAAPASGGESRQTIHVPVYVDGRQVADVLIDRLGQRLSVRGVR